MLRNETELYFYTAGVRISQSIKVCSRLEDDFDARVVIPRFLEQTYAAAQQLAAIDGIDQGTVQACCASIQRGREAVDTLDFNDDARVCTFSLQLASYLNESRRLAEQLANAVSVNRMVDVFQLGLEAGRAEVGPLDPPLGERLPCDVRDRLRDGQHRVHWVDSTNAYELLSRLGLSAAELLPNWDEVQELLGIQPQGDWIESWSWLEAGIVRFRNVLAACESRRAAENATGETQPETESSPVPSEPIKTLDDWPPDNGWHFRKGEYWFRRKKHKLSGKLHALLKLFVNSRGPVGKSSIFDEVWPDNDILITTLNSHVSLLEKHLREEFSLSEDADPIVCKDRGLNLAWEFDHKLFG